MIAVGGHLFLNGTAPQFPMLRENPLMVFDRALFITAAVVVALGATAVLVATRGQLGFRKEP